MAEPHPPRGRVLRCAAVGLHLDPDRATSTEALVSSVAALLDRHLPTDPEVDTLVVLPEHTGLLAMLVGERGAAARDSWGDGGSTLEILMALAGGYGEVLGALSQRHPDVHSPGQLLHLACTDTVVHTLVEGFGHLAAERGIWLSVSAALPRWELVPVTGERTGLAALLAGEAGGKPGRRGSVAVPVGTAVRNRQLLLAPDGVLAAVHDKVALVPMEADGEAGLGLQPASLAEVAVADLPIGRVGTVISKDAWMPDVNERLDQLGAEILLQPEAFDRWGVPDLDEATGRRDLWPPDKFQRGGWWMVQRHPSFQVNVAPMLLGALGELSFDGQPLVAVPSPAGDPALGLLGQPPDTGWAAVGAWWRSATSAPAAGRSQQVQARARAVQQAGGAAGRSAASEVAAVDTIAVADIRLPAHRDAAAAAHAPAAAAHAPDAAADTTRSQVARAVTLGASIEVVGTPDTPAVTELVPDLVAASDRVWLSWVACDRAGRQQLHLASGDGRSWDGAVALSPEPGGGTDPVAARRWQPRLAVDQRGPICVHLGFPAGNWDLFAARPGGDPEAPARIDDADADDGVLRERLHDAPRVIAHDGELLAVWSDLRWPWVFPQIRLARSRDGGKTWSPSVRADGGVPEGEPDPLAGRSATETRGQTTPSVAVCEGRVVVAWQERAADGVPGVWLAWPEARDAPTLLACAPGQRLARPVLAADGPVLWAAWEAWDDAGGAALWATVSLDAGRRWTPPRPLEQQRPAPARRHGACLVATGPRTATVVCVDARAGRARIVAMDLHADAAGQLHAAPPVRIDDAPEGADARAPTAVRLGEELIVVWQDTRSGTDRLRSVRLPLHL